MSIWDTVSGKFNEAVDYVVDKNKTQAKLNRLKTSMRTENEIINEAYAQLGRYYYENLRDNAPTENQDLCSAIDDAKIRFERAKKQYIEIKNENNNNNCGKKVNCSKKSSSSIVAVEKKVQEVVDEQAEPETAGEDISTEQELIVESVVETTVAESAEEVSVNDESVAEQEKAVETVVETTETKSVEEESDTEDSTDDTTDGNSSVDEIAEDLDNDDDFDPRFKEIDEINDLFDKI